jgi:hypothetical protein
MHLFMRTAQGDSPNPKADPPGGERQILWSAPTTALAFLLFLLLQALRWQSLDFRVLLTLH